MVVEMQSFCASPMGESFMKSPLNARGCEVPSGTACYVVDASFSYILNPATFAIELGPIVTGGVSGRFGIGGDSSIVWSHQGNFQTSTSFINQLSPSDLSTVRESPNLNTSPTYGCGGTNDIIWDCDLFPGFLYKRDPVSFSIIIAREFEEYEDPDGIGGSNDRIWFCASDLDLLFELQTPTGIADDFKVLQSRLAPGSIGVDSDQEGIGGGDNVVYHCNTNDQELYRLSPDPLVVELGPVASPTEFSPWGIGGE